MTQDEIILLADASGISLYGMGLNREKFIHYLEAFAKLVAQRERDRICAEQLELPEPRLTGKFSITAGKFKCTGCTGTWADREDAKHHSCKDYQ